MKGRHPSWFKRLSLSTKRGTDESRYAARTLAEAVLRVAAPLIEAAVRTQISAELQRMVEPNPIGDWSNGILAAARVASGTPKENQK